VGAAINERFDLISGYACDDHGVGSNVVNIVIAYLGDMLRAACPLPGSRPHSRHFFPEEVWAGVATGRQVGIAQEFIGLGNEGGGCRSGVGGQNLCNRAALRSSLTGIVIVICHRLSGLMLWCGIAWAEYAELTPRGQAGVSLSRAPTRRVNPVQRLGATLGGDGLKVRSVTGLADVKRRSGDRQVERELIWQRK